MVIELTVNSEEQVPQNGPAFFEGLQVVKCALKKNKKEIYSKSSSTDDEKQKQLAELRAYNRAYYHEHKVAVECQWCKRSFASQTSVNLHLMKNQKCKIKRLEDQVEKLKATHEV
jgi:hypothetical protein